MEHTEAPTRKKWAFIFDSGDRWEASTKKIFSRVWENTSCAPLIGVEAAPGSLRNGGFFCMQYTVYKMVSVLYGLLQQAEQKADFSRKRAIQI